MASVRSPWGGRVGNSRCSRCIRSSCVLSRRARGNTPSDIRVAVPWYKPGRNQTDIEPDYYLHETDEWLVFPHELDALTPEEMQQARPLLYDIVYGQSPKAG